MSSLKREMILDGMTAPQAFIYEMTKAILAVINGQHPDQLEAWRSRGYVVDLEDGVFFLDKDAVILIRNRFYNGRHDDRLLKPSTICKTAERAGMFASDKFGSFQPWSRPSDSSPVIPSQFRMVCSSKALSEKNPHAIFRSPDHEHKPLDLEAIFGEI